MSRVGSRGNHYLWFCLMTSSVAFLGFSFTYFGPMVAGEYGEAPAVVHLHGWTFFLWYLLLPLQAGLVSGRRVAWHRTLGKASVILAIGMVLTGLLVIGGRMRLARVPDGSPFWNALGLPIFGTLVLFAVFYALGLRYRRTREFHKRFILLASTGALGAAGFRVLAEVIGPGLAAGAGGILFPNLIILIAIAVEWRRGDGLHPVYRYGLPATLLVEVGSILLTPTAPGQMMMDALAAMGAIAAPFY